MGFLFTLFIVACFNGLRVSTLVYSIIIVLLLHLHRNPHHWQYWILINDDPKEGIVLLDMPDNYILEMICDWWAFSWKSDNLEEIFKWYEEHGPYMKLSTQTRQKVESALSLIKQRLEEMKNE